MMESAGIKVGGKKLVCWQFCTAVLNITVLNTFYTIRSIPKQGQILCIELCIEIKKMRDKCPNAIVTIISAKPYLCMSGIPIPVHFHDFIVFSILDSFVYWVPLTSWVWHYLASMLLRMRQIGTWQRQTRDWKTRWSGQLQACSPLLRNTGIKRLSPTSSENCTTHSCHRQWSDENWAEEADTYSLYDGLWIIS